MAAEPQACYPQVRVFIKHSFSSWRRSEDSGRCLGIARVQGCLLGPKLCGMLGEGGEVLGAILEARGPLQLKCSHEGGCSQGDPHRGLTAPPRPLWLRPRNPPGWWPSPSYPQSGSPGPSCCSVLLLCLGWQPRWVMCQASDFGSPRDDTPCPVVSIRH